MSWVLFDYGNVVSHPQSGVDKRLLAQAAGCSVDEFTGAYWPHRLDYDRGDEDAESYWQKVGAGVGRTFTRAEVGRLTELDTASWCHINPGTEALIADLAAAGHRLALLSNAPVEVADALAALPVARRFDCCTFSCYLRATKPDPAAYAGALRQWGAAADVTFIDDRPENVVGAAALGMDALLFTGPDQARGALAERGIHGG